MRRFVLPWVAGVVLATSLVCADAQADPAAEADALIARGLDLREQGKDEEALGLFRQAQQKAPSPRARAQVALAEQALGMWVSAETDLSAATADKSDPWIAKNRGPLETALATIRKRLTSLEVRGAENADVYIDGHKLGSGAGPYRVEAGRRTLEVRAQGYTPTSRAIDLPAGGTARENVSLVLAPVVAPPSKPTEPPPLREDPGHGQRILGWVFVGAGAALLATGGASLLVRKNYVDDYNGDDSCPGIGVANQPPGCASQIDSTHTWMTVAIVTLIAGGASLIGGGVIIATAPKASSTSGAGSRPSSSPRSSGISCGLTGCTF